MISRYVLRWPGNLLHFLFLAAVVLICGAAYLIARVATLFLFWNRDRRARAVGTLRGWMLRQAMTTLGATFIKMGQVMSTRPDLFSPQFIEQLSRLQDRLPAFSFRRVRRIVEADLGGKIEDIFSEFDQRPVAAASVAQVHRARLRSSDGHTADKCENGEEVAVKVLRPNVRRQAKRDAAILLAGARVLNLSRTLRLSNPVGHLREFVDAIIDQTDLRIEAENYEKFYVNFDDDPHVSFPAVHEEFSGPSVLTMEFIHGVKIDKLPPGDHGQLATALRMSMFRMCFEHGFLHADLHPGNMMVRDDGSLVMFDVGLAKQLRDDVLAQFIDMSKCLSMGTSTDLVAHLRRFHNYLDGVDWDALSIDVEAFTARFRSKDVAQLEYSELIGGMLAIGRRYRVRPVTDMALIFVALVTAQGIGKMLDPNTNIFAAMAAFLVPILMKRNEALPDSDEARTAQGPTTHRAS